MLKASHVLEVEPLEIIWDANQKSLVIHDEGRVVSAHLVERVWPWRALAVPGVNRELGSCLFQLLELFECLLLPAKACYSV